MDISLGNFITDTLTLTDETILHFVKQGYMNLSTYLNKLIIGIATLYIMTISVRVLYQQASPNVMELGRSFSLLIIIMMLTTHWEFYQRFIYDVFTIEPIELSSYLSGDPDSSVSGINTLWAAGVKTAAQLWKKASIHNLSYYVYGFAVIVATFMTVVYGLGLLVLAKMVVAVLLSLGPVFLLFLLFDPTKELVSGWLKALLHYALVPVLTTATLLLTYTLIAPTLTGLSNAATIPKAGGIVPYVGLCVVCNFLLRQVSNIASSLSGSIAIDGLNALATMARSPLNAFQRLRGGHLDRQERRLRRGKDIGRDRVKRNWNSVKTKANAFRQRLVQGGRR